MSKQTKTKKTVTVNHSTRKEEPTAMSTTSQTSMQEEPNMSSQKPASHPKHTTHIQETIAAMPIHPTLAHHAVPSSLSAEAVPIATPLPAASPSPSATTAASVTVPYLTPPPSSASIPGVPKGFVPESGTSYRAVSPKKAELALLPMAVDDLKKFTSYSAVMGGTAAPYEEIVQTFDVTNQWSSMRTASSAWDVYCRDQEGICWGVMRASMASLIVAFTLAAQRDASLPAKLPGLAALLGVKRDIATRAAATKKANKKAIAEGRAPTHGVVGKKRQKAANKAIVASVLGSASAHPVGATSNAPAAVSLPPAAVPVVVTAPSPAPVAATPVPVNVAPAGQVGASGVTGAVSGTNGVVPVAMA
jgi:hypothetical protein